MGDVQATAEGIEVRAPLSPSHRRKSKGPFRGTVGADRRCSVVPWPEQESKKAHARQFGARDALN